MLKAVLLVGALLATPALAQAVLEPVPTATLYELPTDGPGSVAAIRGTVAWSSISKGVEAVIALPDRGEITLALRKGVDGAGKVQYVIGVDLRDTKNFPTKTKVGTLVFVRPAEGGVGQDLGPWGKMVSESQFEMVLGPSDNLGVLREWHWIDLHIVYPSGQLAYLTVEKDAAALSYFKALLSGYSAKPKFTHATCIGSAPEQPAWMPNVQQRLPIALGAGTMSSPALKLPDRQLGSQCRGACGADCPRTCKFVGTYFEIVVDASRKCQYIIEFPNALQCGTHQGCRVHDNCFDTAIARGETDPNGPIHRQCNKEAFIDWGLKTTDWAVGEGPYDEQWYFVDHPRIVHAFGYFP